MQEEGGRKTAGEEGDTWVGRDAGPYFAHWVGGMTGVVALSPRSETLQEVL